MKEDGLANVAGEMFFYCSKATHTRIIKAAILFGYGTKAIRSTVTDAENKMDTAILIKTINEDGKDGKKPSLIIGNVGDVMPIKINLKPLNKTQSFVFSIISFWMYKF